MAKLIIGINDLATIHPELVKEWDFTKNQPLTPEMVSCGSNKKVWWKCEKGHEWQAQINHRTNRNQGCPYCSGRRVIAGENDLETLYPDIAKEWDYEKNTDIIPSIVKPGSNLKVWWICDKCKHEWKTTVNNRVIGKGCPNCGKKTGAKNRIATLIQKKGSLQTTRPDIAAEWHPTKNGDLTPNDVTMGSNKMVWWQCEQGHGWQAKVVDRRNGYHCPFCFGHRKTSFPEQAVYYYIKKEHEDAISGYTEGFSNTMELDVFIPSLKVGIEYDGIAWHNSSAAKNRELKKYNYCQRFGIKLYRIKEDPLEDKDDACDILINVKGDLNSTIKQLADYKLISSDMDINVQRDANNIRELYKTRIRENSLAIACPEIAKEWHPTKNGALTPEMFHSKSGVIVWWQCKQGHEWQASIVSRTKGHGCPYCCNQKVLVGYNDLTTTNPELIPEWHSVRNGKLQPGMVTYGSGKQVWWKCSKCGHEWKSDVKSRSKGVGCPACANKVAINGVNDLVSTVPELAAEWHPTKNGSLTPDMFSSGSGKKVWWQCEQGHEWQASIVNRSRGRRCPYCSNKKLLKGFNDLETVAKPLLKVWDYKNNSPLTPNEIIAYSSKRVWWECPSCGHKWQKTVRQMVLHPVCANCHIKYRNTTKD